MTADTSAPRLWPYIVGLLLLSFAFATPYIFQGGGWVLPNLSDLFTPHPLHRVYPTDLDNDANDEMLLFRDLDDGMRLQAVDARTGGHLWSRDIEGLSVQMRGGIRRSGDTLVVAQKLDEEPSHGLVGIDLEDREVAWRRISSVDGRVDPFVHEDVVVAAVDDLENHDLRAFGAETGDRRWDLPTSELTCHKCLGTAAGYLFAWCMEPSSSPRLYRISMGSGDHEGFAARSQFLTTFRPDGTAFVMRDAGDDPEASSFSLHRIPLDAESSTRVTRHGEPVTVPYYPGGLAAHRHTVLMTRRDDIRHHIELRALPVTDRGTEFRWQVPDGDALEKPFGGFHGPKRPSSTRPFYLPDADIVPMFVGRRLEADDRPQARSLRLVLFDLQAGKPRWQSRSFDTSSGLNGDRNVHRHGDLFAVHLGDVGGSEFPPGHLLLTLDATTGELVAAIQFRVVAWSSFTLEQGVSDGILYGSRHRQPWTVDLRTGEVLYGPTLETRNVTSQIESALGEFPDPQDGP